MNTPSRLLWAALLLSFSAHADIWKVKKPDGTYEYGNGTAMPPGAVRIDVEKAAPNVIPPYVVQPSYAPLNRSVTQQADGSSNDNIKTLRDALEKAEKDAISGESPLPGEHSGNVKGGSRLNEDYFIRQKKLKDALEQAKKAYESALKTTTK